MHNRARLLVASFLTKTLYIDWRVGASHFDALLVDADLANNVGNWQWVAGTGNDTRPNRVLNPIRQAHRFDRTATTCAATCPSSPRSPAAPCTSRGCWERPRDGGWLPEARDRPRRRRGGAAPPAR